MATIAVSSAKAVRVRFPKDHMSEMCTTPPCLNTDITSFNLEYSFSYCLKIMFERYVWVLYSFSLGKLIINMFPIDLDKENLCTNIIRINSSQLQYSNIG